MIIILLAIVGYNYFTNNQQEIDTQNIESFENINNLNQEDVDAKDTLPASRYICFTSDEQNSNNLMFGLDDKGTALFAQYEGQRNIIELDFVSSDFPTPGYSTYTLTYNEIVDGDINGTYVQTHSGNYDYLEYTDNEGKVYNFTNILEESYINNSCL